VLPERTEKPRDELIAVARPRGTRSSQCAVGAKGHVRRTASPPTSSWAWCVRTLNSVEDLAGGPKDAKCYWGIRIPIATSHFGVALLFRA
jgi:hypothetical protein